MHDMIRQSIKVVVLLGLFSSPLVETAPTITSTLSSKSGSQSNSDLTCGKTGWNGSQESFLSTGYCNSWAYCQSVCELHSGCQSFAYFDGASGDTGGDCELYSVPVQGNFVADSSSPYKFYDKSCLTAEKQCNTKGYSRIDSFIGINANSVGDCATVCSGYNEYSTGCVSYAFGKGTCLLYSYLVVDNVDIDSTSDFIFNDALCGQSASTMITTTTTTKSIGKMTTTTKVTSSTKAPSTMTTTKTITTTKNSSTTKSTTTPKAPSMTMTTTTAPSTAVASNSPQCGVAGWYRTDFISESSVDSLSSCGGFCYDFSGGSSNCLAYAYSDEGDCRLYNSSVADSVWLTSTSEFKNYDLACYSSIATTTTTNKTGHTTTTTTALVPTTTTGTTSTKKSSQTTVTTTSVAPGATTSSSATQCGILGWGRADPIFDFSVNSLSSCADFCYDYSGGSTKCQSYAYSPAAGECRLYNSTVAANVWANSDSDYGNYDLACRGVAGASTSTRITATTTSLSGKTITTATTTTNKPSQGVTTTTTSIKKSTSKSTSTATTKTTTSRPAATTTASSTAQSQCGVVGWGRADAFFDYVGDTLQECAQACFNNRGAPNNCLSYAYGYTGNECRLYSNVSVADNVYVNSGSDFGNYDLSCYNASLNIDTSVCTPGYHGAQCNYKLNYDQNAGGSYILNSFDDCVIRCNSITNCRHVVWYRQAAKGVPQNTCQLLGDPSEGGVALNGVDSADRF